MLFQLVSYQKTGFILKMTSKQVYFDDSMIYAMCTTILALLEWLRETDFIGNSRPKSIGFFSLHQGFK